MTSIAAQPLTGAGRRRREMVLEADETAVAAVRMHVECTLRSWGMSRLAEDATLIVSELATNAVRHAGDVVLLRCSVSERKRFLMEVWDPCAELPTVGAPGFLGVGGRGLMIVEALAADWGAHRVDEGGKIVWAALDLP
jgi:anti-sigma regulatory factor (Ser/Thr protein kinase)